jgi:asparagine synthase (glutamine-hydrolysing)
MCGIFTLLNNEPQLFSNAYIESQFLKGKNRGPEHSHIEQVDIKATAGFHRLAINGLNNESNQPIVINNLTLICNGEIYNYKELYKLMEVKPQTDSDCEVIIHLYLKYGITQTLQMLDGVFAFILFENNLNDINSKIFVARDPYGVRPLYILKSLTKSIYYPIIGFASELKVLNEMHFILNKFSLNYEINQFQPGTYSYYYLPFNVNATWKLIQENISYHSTGFNFTYIPINYKNLNDISSILENIQLYLTNAVKKRVQVTERPIACLLSGGLDSSLVTALVNEEYKIMWGYEKKLETYSIGLEGSEDLKYAKIVANYLNTKHTEIIITEEEMMNVIPDVIYSIESYDTTTIRASIGNYLLGKYISENSDAKVIFNGDGSDELCGGYKYMDYCPDCIEFDKECRRLLKDIHNFDVLRSDKCISSHGLEPRTPFLDRSWVQYYLSISPEIRYHLGNKQVEKYLIRNAFSKHFFLNTQSMPLLPDEILWRKKEAFSDGVCSSNKNRYLNTIIQDKLNNNSILPQDEKEKYVDSIFDSDEKKYYKNLFDYYYFGLDKIVPYLWMPKYIKSKNNDPSAKTLEM